MPNWCVNQIHVDGPDAECIEQLLTEPKALLYRQATRAAVKMFLAGVGGVLKPTHPLTFALYPELVLQVGESTEANRAFTRFVSLLNQDVVLDDDHCQLLLTLFDQTGLKQRYWGDLPKAARQKIAPLLDNSAFDWCSIYLCRLALDEVWAKLDLPEPLMDEGCFSLNALLPPRLLVELNGFNGRLFSHVPSGYDDNCDRLGTKWEAVNIEVLDEGTQFEFDTAWSPAIPPVAELARRFPNTTITHYFSESGCAFCGYLQYTDGQKVAEQWDELVFEENDEGYHDAVSPDYIVDYFNQYGG
ncbi:DUF1281 domain-containing protein [Vibrio parahaemolyticus]|uniref:DUF1281 domain-containing protein n=1 Tax=Vibrio parahaemolyticus TaxID=670 RepID=UPI001E60C621|nr:DUF1281 domain-containing protein [Vibrio parahaemolyticus]MCD1416871.1 DUF1281 domain-containing protein [Vibrio parahaemolyticus]